MEHIVVIVLTPVALLLGVKVLQYLVRVDALLQECSKPVTRGLCGWSDHTYYE